MNKSTNKRLYNLKQITLNIFPVLVHNNKNSITYKILYKPGDHLET